MRQPLIPPVGGGPKTYPPHPKGRQLVTCIDVIDRGLRRVVWEGNERMVAKVTLRFWAGKWRQDAEDPAKKYPHLLDAWFTFSFHPKASLRGFVERWLGEKLTDQEANHFDLWKLVGRHAMVQVTHNTVGDKTYANIDTIMAVEEGEVGPGAPPDYVMVADRPPLDGSSIGTPARRPSQPAVPWAQADDDPDDLPF